MNGLVAALQSGSSQLAKSEKTGERTEKALMEITGILGKVADSLRLRNAVEENTKEQWRREERWIEIERKRDEE